MHQAAASLETGVTDLLHAWSGGDAQAFERLVPLVYHELRRLADRALARERTGHTLQPTALVHEAYLELVDQREPHFRNRGHFFALAAFVMRRFLVEHARSRRAAKRGAGVAAVELAEEIAAADQPLDEILAVDQALTRLAELDARQARIVELRYFAGLSFEETAEAAEVSLATAKREWATARAWLKRELSSLP